MKKSLLAVAVAAALPTLAFAQSNVTLSGYVKNGLSSYKLSNGAAGTNGSGTVIDDGSSRFVISGTEDLGGGLKAIFMWDNRLRADHGSGTLGSGVSYVGLAGNFGQIRVGRIDQHYLVGLDTFSSGATALSAANVALLSYINTGSLGQAIANTSRTANLIRFDSANYSGVTFGLGYSTNYNGPEGGAGDAGKGGAVTANVAYNAGPLGLGLSVWDAKNEPKTTSQKAVRVAGKYDFGMFTAGLAFDQSKQTLSPTSGQDKRNAFSVPFTAKLGPGTALLTYTQAQSVKNSGSGTLSDSGARMIAVGYDYPLSKRTSLGITYARIDNKKNAAYSLFTQTALHDIPLSGVGQDVSQLQLGIKHAF